MAHPWCPETQRNENAALHHMPTVQSYTWLSKLTVREVLSSQLHSKPNNSHPITIRVFILTGVSHFLKNYTQTSQRQDGQIISKEEDVNFSHREKHKKLWDVCLEILK